jgi:hypothetical protein
MAVKLRWITGWANARHRFNYSHIYTSEYSSRNNYYRVLINAANNGCDQAVSNNAVAVITPDLLVTTQPQM